jgi:hypothetical protein
MFGNVLKSGVSFVIKGASIYFTDTASFRLWDGNTFEMFWEEMYKNASVEG